MESPGGACWVNQIHSIGSIRPVLSSSRPVLVVGQTRVLSSRWSSRLDLSDNSYGQEKALFWKYLQIGRVLPMDWISQSFSRHDRPKGQRAKRWQTIGGKLWILRGKNEKKSRERWNEKLIWHLMGGPRVTLSTVICPSPPKNPKFGGVRRELFMGERHVEGGDQTREGKTESPWGNNLGQQPTEGAQMPFSSVRRPRGRGEGVR